RPRPHHHRHGHRGARLLGCAARELSGRRGVSVMAMWDRRTEIVAGLETSWLEAGVGPPLVLLHGGEFGASAELGWETVIPALAERFRVIAPDVLGFGYSAKVV